MEINVFTLHTALQVNKRKIIRLVKKIIRDEKYQLHVLNIVIADNNYLKKLNQMFLKKKCSTNVISFNLGDISEIYVSADRAKTYRELYYCIAHGLLHIIGYDHQKRKQEELMHDKCSHYIAAL
jgi:probable rRNA maturation factor